LCWTCCRHGITNFCVPHMQLLLLSDSFMPDVKSDDEWQRKFVCYSLVQKFCYQ